METEIPILKRKWKKKNGKVVKTTQRFTKEELKSIF